MSSLHMFSKKKHVLQWNFRERVLNYFFRIFGILNSFSNPCTSETLYCHFHVIFNIDNPSRMEILWAGNSVVA